MKKISLKDVENGLKRDEMLCILGGGGCGEPSGSANPWGYWDYVPYNYGTTGINSGNNGTYGAIQFLTNVGIGIVNAAAWVGNQVYIPVTPKKP